MTEYSVGERVVVVHRGQKIAGVVVEMAVVFGQPGVVVVPDGRADNPETNVYIRINDYRMIREKYHHANWKPNFLNR